MVSHMRVIDQRLLGRLSQMSWFTANGEVAATRCLGFMLEHRILREATTDWLSTLAGVDLSEVQRFVVEAVNSDGNRPDVEGLDVAGRPLLVVEAKFGALMTQAQVSGYLADQSRRLSPGARGALVLLTPDAREAEARLKLEMALHDQPKTPDRVVTLATTWGQ